MRDYSKVLPHFWIGDTGKLLRKNHEAQIVSFYLVTSPHANMLGLYYLPVSFLSHETGLTFEGACKGLERCIEVGFCAYDEASEMVWVVEMARYQIGDCLKAEDKRCAGVQNEYNTLPQNPFLSRFFDKYRTPFNMKTKRENASPYEAPSKTLRSQEQEQEQEQEKIKPLSASPVGFADFWSAYPKKKSKGDAEKVWKRIKPDLQIVLSAIERAKTSADWLKEQGQFIPHPATWLNAKGWEDECTPASASNTGGCKPWYMAASTIEKEAERLNIEKLPGELFPVFKARVFKAAGVTEEMLRAANSDFGARA